MLQHKTLPVSGPKPALGDMPFISALELERLSRSGNNERSQLRFGESAGSHLLSRSINLWTLQRALTQQEQLYSHLL